MAYDQYSAERITQVLEEKKVSFLPKKMFGGLVFMVNEKMCVGLLNEKGTDNTMLLCRLSIEEYEKALENEFCVMMSEKMKGFIFVHPDGYDMQSDLEYWIQLCLDFNPFAKKSKKKKPSIKKK